MKREYRVPWMLFVTGVTLGPAFGFVIMASRGFSWERVVLTPASLAAAAG